MTVHISFANSILQPGFTPLAAMADQKTNEAVAMLLGMGQKGMLHTPSLALSIVNLRLIIKNAGGNWICAPHIS